MQTKPAYSAGPALSLPPDLSLLGVFWTLADDIRQALASDSPDAAKLSAIGSFLDERMPGPPGGMPSLLPEGDDPLATLARRLSRGELFTAVAGDLARDAISARVVRSASSSLNRAEAGWLAADPAAARCWRRRGELRTATGNALAARVTSVVLPDRVRDSTALKALARTDEPLGAVLAPLGVRREPLWSFPYCSRDVVLNNCARLWLPDPDGISRPVGLATEAVMRLDWWARP